MCAILKIKPFTLRINEGFKWLINTIVISIILHDKVSKDDLCFPT